MENKSTIPFWSIDTYLYFMMPVEKILSSELISRINTFLEAYIIFDKIVLPARYQFDEIVKLLDADGTIFEFIDSKKLFHSDELSKGISIDLSLDFTKFDDLNKENYKWTSEHMGFLDKKDYEKITKNTNITMAHLRLWQLGLVEEISDLTYSTPLLPLSLCQLEQYINVNNKNIPIILENFHQLDKHYQDIIRSISMQTTMPFTGYLESIPPFFSLLIDQSFSIEHSIDILISLRNDYKEMRLIGSQHQTDIMKTDSLRDKKDILDNWNEEWNILLKNDFRKPTFLRRKIATSDVSKSIVQTSAGIATIIQSFLEYQKEIKSYKRFKIYSDIYNELESTRNIEKKLENIFDTTINISKYT